MNCPVCKTATFVPRTLASNLTSEHCTRCEGDWILGANYWAWILSKPEAPLVGGAPAAGDDHREAKLCPQCGKLLRRFDIGREIPFGLDHCGTCGGFWLDAGEFDCLAHHGLAGKLHLIIAPDWQAGVAQARQRIAYEELLRTHLGASDFAEIQRLKAWLDAHPRREELLAYLLNQPAA